MARLKFSANEANLLSVLYNKKITQILVFVLILFFFIYPNTRAESFDLFPIKLSWEIQNPAHVKISELETLIEPLLDKKLTLNLNAIKKTLESQPWVKSAEVRRLIWNNIQIKIQEQDIALRWGETGYISQGGELFFPEKMVESNALQIFSNRTDPESIKNLYSDFNHYKQLLSPMQIESMRRSYIDVLSIKPNIELVLGYRMQKQRILRFKKIYQKLPKNKKKGKKVVFDLRYPKGFALSYPKQ